MAFVQQQPVGDFFEIPLHPSELSGRMGVAAQVKPTAFLFCDPVRAEMDLHLILRQIQHIDAVAAVNGDAAAPGDEALDLVAGHRIAALGEADRQVVHSLDHDAAVALAESINYELQAIGADIAMGVFCPGYVQTNLDHSEWYRPERFKDETDPYYQSEEFMNQQYRLIVCTCDGNTTSGGKVTFFDVDGVNSTVTKGEQYTGFGKIVDILYRERSI